MKKFFAGTVLVCFLIVFFTFKNNISQQTEPSNNMVDTDVVEAENFPTVTFGTDTYGYVLFRVESPIVIIQNDLQEDFLVVTKRNKCKYAVNGGFYTTENEPLGLVQINGEVLSSRITSLLFDGFLGTKDMEGYIGREPYADAPNILQSGPVLIENGAVVPLNIQQDKLSRRSVAIVTDTHILYFVTLFSTDSRFSGPYLSDLPSVVMEIARAEGIHVDWAINLDGGSASAIKTPDKTLPEFRTVKTIICIK